MNRIENHIEDERIRFYLEHADRIKEWAAIEKDVPEVAHRFFLSLRKDVDETIKRDGWQAISCVRRDEDSMWPQVGLRRTTWPYISRDSPDVGEEFYPKIVIEWHRPRTAFSGASLVCGAHVGSCGQELGQLKELEEFDHPPYREGPNQFWFRYRRLNPPYPGFWKDDGLAKYREYLLSQLFKAWHALAPAMDIAVKLMTKPPAAADNS